MNKAHLLLSDPVEYAKRAFACIVSQLTTVRGENRKAKLQRRLKKWATALELFTENTENKPAENSSSVIEEASVSSEK